MLQKYDLPTISEILIEAPTKNTWRKIVREQVHTFWKDKLQSTASNMSTLQFMNINMSTESHHTVRIIRNPNMTKKANVKFRLLTGTYSLQYTRVHVYRQQMSATCLLCKTDDETLQHFILTCPTLNTVRELHIHKIIGYISHKRNTQFHLLNDHLKLHLILDATHHCIKDLFLLKKEDVDEIEELTHNYLYALHFRTCSLLNDT